MAALSIFEEFKTLVGKARMDYEGLRETLKKEQLEFILNDIGLPLTKGQIISLEGSLKKDGFFKEASVRGLFSSLTAFQALNYRYGYLGIDQLSKHDREIATILEENYQMKTWLHSSTRSEVRIVKRVSDHQEQVVKVIIYRDKYCNEKKILEMLGGNHHTISLTHSYEFDSLRLNLLFFNRFLANIIPEPHQLKSVMTQLMEALSFCHTFGIIHRDIKPSNILFKSENGTLQLFLADFGLAVIKTCHSGLTTAGSIPYIAPEIFLPVGDYDELVDVWSAGVLFFKWVVGQHPFYVQPEEQLTEEYTQLDYYSQMMNFYSSKYPVFLEQYNFIGEMMDPNPSSRPSAQNILEIMALLEE